MKRIKLIFVATIMLMLAINNTSTLQAKAITTLEIQPTEEGKIFLLSIKTLGEGALNIILLDAEQHQLFQQEVNGKTGFFKKRFNLSNLGINEYQLLIEDDMKMIRQPVQITAEGMIINVVDRQIIYKPIATVNHASKQLDLNWLLPSQKDFDLQIKNWEDETIYSASDDNVRTVHRRFDISQLACGSYYLILDDGDNRHIRIIDIH